MKQKVICFGVKCWQDGENLGLSLFQIFLPPISLTTLPRGFSSPNKKEQDPKAEALTNPVDEIRYGKP